MKINYVIYHIILFFTDVTNSTSTRNSVVVREDDFSTYQSLHKSE